MKRVEFGFSSHVYLVAVAAVAVAIPAFGQIVNYDLTNTATDTWVVEGGGPSSGASISGTFSYDWTLGQLTAADLTLSGGGLSTVNYLLPDLSVDASRFTQTVPSYTSYGNTYATGSVGAEITSMLGGYNIYLDFTQNVTSMLYPGNVTSGGGVSGIYSSLTAAGTIYILASTQSVATGATATNIDGAGSVYSSADLGSTVNPVFSGGTLQIASSGTISTNFTLDNSGTNTIDANGKAAVFSGNFTDATTAGTLSIAGSGSVTLTGTGNTYSGQTTVATGATLIAGANNAFSQASATSVQGTLDLGGYSETVDTVTLNGGTIQNGTLISSALDTQSGVISAAIAGTGTLTQNGNGTTTLSGANTYTGSTNIAGGTLALSGSGSIASSSSIVDNGTFDISALTDGGTSIRTLSGAGGVVLGANTLTLSNASGSLSGVVQGTGGVTLSGGALTLSGTNSYTGSTNIAGGTLALSGSGSIASSSGVMDNGTFDISALTNGGTSIRTLSGAGGVMLGANTLTVSNASGSLSGVVQGTGGVTLSGGALTLSGANTYTGATNITGGTLILSGSGSIASSSLTTVGSHAILTGTGSVGNTQVDTGGTFTPGSGTPGSSMTVSGNLAFQSGGNYRVTVNPSTASFAKVTGAATLGGSTVNAMFSNGTYIAKQYTILTANSLSGTFGALESTNLPTNFSDSLSYDANHAYLNLTLNFAPPPSGPTAPNFGNGLSRNQNAVGNALIGYFNTTGGIPQLYGTLTPAGLTQASGTLATGSQQATFDAMDLFMGLLTDPFLKREGRGSVWAAEYGGSQSTNGNTAVGSSDASSSIYATAVGTDYSFSANTTAGFALAGGGTDFTVNGSGSGRSDLIQAGAYARHTQGPTYISAVLAYGWQNIITDRTVTIAGVDQLHANFDANAYSGRIEGGYRFGTPATGGIAITPYAAGQITTFDLPGYAESAAPGRSAFALNYGATKVSDARSELGFRGDRSFALSDGVLTLRSRLAWAHDYGNDRSIAATIQALPGASFVVDGAAQAANSALTTASLEMKWRNGWSAAVTFDGRFSDVTNFYAGKAIARYQW